MKKWNPAVDALITEDADSFVPREHSSPTTVSIKPNLKPEVARWASECLRVDCGRTGGHSFCQTERDWWSGLERWPGVFSYSNGRDRDSWTLYIGLCVHVCIFVLHCICARLYGDALCSYETTEDMKQLGDCGATELTEEYCTSIKHF